MKKLAHGLGEALGRDEVLRKARAQSILKRWDEVVGPMLATKSQPDRYERGTVFVAVTGSAWAQELRMRRDMILARLVELAGEPSLFSDIRFGMRPVEEQPEEAMATDSGEDHRQEIGQLSIREIAERRLEKWRSED
jgi:predicted nucleic acid-binding Zn ribbon protein